MEVSGNVYRSTVITATSAIESLVSETPRSGKISSEYTCQAMVEYPLELNISFNQLVHNSRIDLAIFSNDKGAGARMA